MHLSTIPVEGNLQPVGCMWPGSNSCVARQAPRRLLQLWVQLATKLTTHFWHVVVRRLPTTVLCVFQLVFATPTLFSISSNYGLKKQGSQTLVHSRMNCGVGLPQILRLSPYIYTNAPQYPKYYSRTLMNDCNSWGLQH